MVSKEKDMSRQEDHNLSKSVIQASLQLILCKTLADMRLIYSAL